MITRKPTKKVLEEWNLIWKRYKDVLKPNRKSGAEVLSYLQSHYILTEIDDENALSCISESVKENEYLAEKLPEGASTIPRAFYLENAGNGRKFYLPENKDDTDVWGDIISKIFVGVELSSGSYQVEGSTMLWDELCAFQGIDEKDLKNYVVVADYINSLKRFGKLNTVISE